MMTETLKEFFKKTSWFQPYKAFSYFYPPRIEHAVPIEDVARYDVHEYLAQMKFNGNCCLVFMNGIDLHVRDRHGKPFSPQNKPVHEKNGEFMRLYSETLGDNIPQGKWMVLVGEYMLKSKDDENGENWNNNFVIFDILAYDGMLLIKSTNAERQAFLSALYGDTPANGEKGEILYTTHVGGCYRAKSFPEGFAILYNKWVSVDMIEGIVIKNLYSGLEQGNSEKNGANSAFKFRKPTKNYQH